MVNSRDVAARIATALDESSDDMRNLAARVAEMAALCASIDLSKPRVTDAEALERLEGVAHAALYHMQAHDRLVQELALVCEALGHPLDGMPRRGRKAFEEPATERGSVELF